MDVFFLLRVFIKTRLVTDKEKQQSQRNFVIKMFLKNNFFNNFINMNVNNKETELCQSVCFHRSVTLVAVAKVFPCR